MGWKCRENEHDHHEGASEMLLGMYYYLHLKDGNTPRFADVLCRRVGV